MRILKSYFGSHLWHCKFGIPLLVQEVKKELEQEFAGDDFEDELGTFFLDTERD